jgi:hypothetical protein
MKRHVKKALAVIDSIDMFSPFGWERVHNSCRDISTHDDGSVLIDGFTHFLLAWYDDNDIEAEDITEEEEEKIRELLLERYVDYLLHD